jgi:hypothetical protein
LVVEAVEFILEGFDEVFLVCSAINIGRRKKKVWETFRGLIGNTKNLLLGSIFRALSMERVRIRHSTESTDVRRVVGTDL